MAAFPFAVALFAAEIALGYGGTYIDALAYGLAGEELDLPAVECQGAGMPSASR